jgi:hypothetical protein
MKIDGLDNLLNLFKNSEDDFVNHFIQSVYFINPNSVKEQSEKIIQKIQNGEKIPVRYSQAFDGYYEVESDKIEKIKEVDNLEKAKKLTRKNDVFLKKSNIKIIVDNDGNDFVVRAIKEVSGHVVSKGQTISSVINYTLSHIWENTHNPLYFSLLWNIAIVPTYLNFIMDKDDSSSKMVKNIKDLMKAICYKLYKPNDIMKEKLVAQPSAEISKQADRYINSGEIKFLPRKEKSKTKIRQRRNKDSNSINDKEAEIDKVKRKVPRWLNNPHQINSRILISFMDLLKENDYVEYDQLYNRCIEIETFEKNFNQMKNFGEKNHGKVFDQIDEKVYLWKPVREFVTEEYRKYLERTH